MHRSLRQTAHPEQPLPKLLKFLFPVSFHKRFAYPNLPVM